MGTLYVVCFGFLCFVHSLYNSVDREKELERGRCRERKRERDMGVCKERSRAFQVTGRFLWSPFIYFFGLTVD